ncbi:MAG: alpha/beta hydrolase [Oscillospiraceae bacterium]
MMLVHTHFYAATLGMQREMDVLLPDRLGDSPRYPDGRIPVLYLLHGWSGSHSDWQRLTGIERYAGEKGIAVVMPSTDLSFYADMKYGYDFFRFMDLELPALVAEFFPALSARREDTFVGGLSMGGYGAMKLGILRPERFAAVISLSGGFDIPSMYAGPGEVPPAMLWSYGSCEEVTGSEDDLPFQLEKQLEKGTALPKFFLSCGQQDFLYQGNVACKERFGSRLDMTWHEEPGDHTWDYWDRNIQRAIDWLPLAARKEM